ncbi:glutathione S-transferase family protein [Temperatibacter marinus]|uniref:Glutathione S-transferase family protein n=1 Tax=Temperatibacter marinus TaxID=1456591 RepID=A0AA52EI25_9PROT|nr:glutathione S-transferase family protein [Temperatibacter marinus]WND03558.1 glutathione S-transferase family protein [Temperatibacter marinus]
MADYTLYHCKNSRSQRVLWTLEELGLDYTLHQIPFPPRLRYKDYLDINPLGTVPAFFIGDTLMTESSAIAHYLCEKHSPTTLAPTHQSSEYPAFLDWLYRSDTTYTFPIAIALRYTYMEPEGRRLQQAKDDYIQWFFSRLKHVNSRLESHNYLVGDSFTIADICVSLGLSLGEQALGLGETFKPQTKDWLSRIKDRPAYERLVEIDKNAPDFLSDINIVNS